MDGQGDGLLQSTSAEESSLQILDSPEERPHAQLSLQMLGCSFKTSPIETRERVAHFLSLAEHRILLHSLPGVTESALLITCNRIEVMLVTRNPALTRAAFFELLRRVIPKVDEQFHCLEGTEALKHLFSISSGLDSMVLGEEQILTQVRETGISERTAGFSKSVLSTVFDAAYRVGRLVRSRYPVAIRGGSDSVGGFAAKVIAKRFTEPRTLVIGTGTTIRLAVRALSHSRLYVATKRQKLPDGLMSAERISYAEIGKFARRCDLIICGTDHNGFLIKPGDLSAKRQTVVLDLAFPRNADPAIRSKNVRLYNLDDLARHASRLKADHNLRDAELLISTEADDIQRWLMASKLSSTLSALHRWIETVRREETEKALRRLPNLSAHEREVVEVMGKRIASKLSSPPTNFAKSQAQTLEQNERLSLLEKIFSLETKDEEDY